MLRPGEGESLELCPFRKKRFGIKEMPKALRIATIEDGQGDVPALDAYGEQTGSWGEEASPQSGRGTVGGTNVRAAGRAAKEPNSIQAVSRTLSLLRELNLNNGATILALAAAVNLPRGTVYRMMENLKALGYVRKDPHTRGYWIERICQE